MQLLIPHRHDPSRPGAADGSSREVGKRAKGITYATLNGLLSGMGGLTLFAAYHTGGNTTIITAATALYPMITVVLAVTVLREPFRPKQVLGLLFAAIAFVIFSPQEGSCMFRPGSGTRC